MTELGPGRSRVEYETLNEGSLNIFAKRPSSQFSICRRPNTAQHADITRNTMMTQDKAANKRLWIFLKKIRTGSTSCRTMAKLPNT